MRKLSYVLGMMFVALFVSTDHVRAQTTDSPGQSLMRTVSAQLSVQRLRWQLATTTGVFVAASSNEKRQSMKEHFDNEHKKAKEGDYHRDWHEAMRNNGGERLREEYNKWCYNRRLQEAELNC